jgi:hypothetical protein
MNGLRFRDALGAKQPPGVFLIDANHCGNVIGFTRMFLDRHNQ